MNQSGGRIIKGTGDGVLATFPLPSQASKAAVGIRDRLRGLGIEIRAGVHVGEVDDSGFEIHGITVNIASRLEKAAEDGQVLASGAVREMSIGSDVRFQDAGTRQLKGLPGTWPVYDVSIDESQ